VSTLDLNGFNQTVASITYNGAGLATGTKTITNSDAVNAAVITINNATDNVSGIAAGANNIVLTGNLGLTKEGAGMLTLLGTSSYTGITNINAGTLRIGSATALGAQTGESDRTIIASGATLDLGGVALGANNEFITVSGAGVGGNGAITSSTAIATPFIGVRFLTLAGDTTLGFTNRWDVGNNTTGGTLTGGGFTLNLVGSGAGQASFNGLGETDLGDININLGSAATSIAYLQGNTTLGQTDKTVTISGGTALEFFTNVTLTSYDKKFALNTGKITVGKTGGVALPGTISLAGTNTITASSAAVAITASGVISGAGDLVKAGAGLLTLTNENT
jgi:autotransporter-associated beta strand protein